MPMCLVAYQVALLWAQRRSARRPLGQRALVRLAVPIKRRRVPRQQQQRPRAQSAPRETRKTHRFSEAENSAALRVHMSAHCTTRLASTAREKGVRCVRSQP